MKPDNGEKLDSQEELLGREKINIDGEEVLCRRVDMMKEYEKAFETADSYRKVGIVDVRQATEEEVISTRQDGGENKAKPGDYIIHNPGDKDPYVFGDEGDTIEVRQQKFIKKYEPIDGKSGKFRPKGIIKAVQVFENIVFKASWGDQMAIKAGGWVSDGGYSIAEDSFNKTYEKIIKDDKK